MQYTLEIITEASTCALATRNNMDDSKKREETRYMVLGWGEIKKCSPMDSGILVEYADIYRRLLGLKNPGLYFIKLSAMAIVVLWYYNYYNGSFA